MEEISETLSPERQLEKRLTVLEAAKFLTALGVHATKKKP